MMLLHFPVLCALTRQEMQQQVLLGERLLESLFPGLQVRRGVPESGNRLSNVRKYACVFRFKSCRRFFRYSERRFCSPACVKLMHPSLVLA